MRADRTSVSAISLVAATFLLACLALTAAPTRAHAQSIAFGAFSPGANYIPENLDAFIAKAGRSPAIINYYRRWNDRIAYESELRNIDAHGAIPLITWEPFERPLREIVAGEHDDYIRSSAAHLTDWGKPAFVRFAHEMNGDWYPWGTASSSADDYKHAWRRIVSIFREEGASNVQFVWSPNVDDGGTLPFTHLYPGDSWVDWVALDGYNFGANGGGWKSFSKIFASSYETMNSLTSKPLMIAETGSSELGGDKAAWITSALNCELPRDFPRVQSVLFFDRAFSGVESQLDSSPASHSAFRAAISQQTYALGGSALLSGQRSPSDAGCDAEPPGQIAEPPVQIAKPPGHVAEPSGQIGVLSGARLKGSRRMGIRVKCLGGPCSSELTVTSGGRMLGRGTARVEANQRKLIWIDFEPSARRAIKRKLSNAGKLGVTVFARSSDLRQDRTRLNLRARG